MITPPHSRTLAVIAAASALASCVRGSVPPRELYRLVPADTVAVGRALRPGAGTPPLDGALTVVQYATPGLYGDPQIVYRVNDAQYEAYRWREWGTPLGTMLAARTADVLRAAALAPGPVVAELAERNAHDYEWRGVVSEFEEVDLGSRLLAAVRLDASIVRSRTDSILWHGSVRYEAPVPGSSMESVVGTLSSLADSAIVDLARQAGRALRTGPVAERAPHR